MTFERKTNELYGAKNAGFQIDQDAAREIDNELAQRLIAKRGRNFVDGKLDSLYDFDGDLYEGNDGTMYAVVFVDDDGKTVPLCWQRLTARLWYAVQTDREDDWGTGSYDREKALEMARKLRGDHPDALVAVIDNRTSNPVCVEEITDLEA